MYCKNTGQECNLTGCNSNFCSIAQYSPKQEQHWRPVSLDAKNPDEKTFIQRGVELSEPSFQAKVHSWMLACFGKEIAGDKRERCHRFFEESLELVQSLGMSKEDALMLVDYVYNRQIGEPEQECGGVMVTLAALSTACGLNMQENGETELARVWQKIDKIREKQKGKPRNSPLPQVATPQHPVMECWVEVPASKRLPPKHGEHCSGYVFVVMSAGFIACACYNYNSKDWHNEDGEVIRTPRHWLERTTLPAPLTMQQAREIAGKAWDAGYKSAVDTIYEKRMGAPVNEHAGDRDTYLHSLNLTK